jgi:hypothetical protein
MELFILLVLVLVANPELLGRHLAEIKHWYDYYMQTRSEKMHKAIVLRRAKNIKRIRNERFKKNVT